MTTPLQSNVSKFYTTASAQKKTLSKATTQLIGMDENIPYMATLTFLTQTTSLREKNNITL